MAVSWPVAFTEAADRAAVDSGFVGRWVRFRPRNKYRHDIENPIIATAIIGWVKHMLFTTYEGQWDLRLYLAQKGIT